MIRTVREGKLVTAEFDGSVSELIGEMFAIGISLRKADCTTEDINWMIAALIAGAKASSERVKEAADKINTVTGMKELLDRLADIGEADREDYE